MNFLEPARPELSYRRLRLLGRWSSDKKPGFSSLYWWKVPVGAQRAAELCVIDCSAAEHHVPTQIFVVSWRRSRFHLGRCR